MKIVKEIILKLFSICMLAASLIVLLGTAEIINLKKGTDTVFDLIFQNTIVSMAVAVVIAILSIVGLLSSMSDPEDNKTGVSMSKATGKVFISKETFEAIILSVVKNFASLKNYKVSIALRDDGITANVYTYILPDTVVPTLTSKLQESIKDTILKQTTVELKEVNVKVKGVYQPAEKNVAQS